MGTAQQKKGKYYESSKTGIASDNFCVRVENSNGLVIEDKNEIILSKTYSYPKVLILFNIGDIYSRINKIF
jgi:hypothetical protein